MQAKNLLTFVLACFLFCFEVFLLFTLSGLGIFFVLHLIVILLLVSYAYWVYRLKENLLYPLLLLAFTIGAGPFGLGTFLLVFLLRPLFSFFATPSAIWFEGLFPKPSITHFEQIIQRIKSQWDDYGHLDEASSFENLFSYGSLMDKQKVLDVIATDFDPQYSSMLKRALRDSENVVRIQAAAIATKIDHDFNHELKKLQSQHQDSPEQFGILLRLAEFSEAYALAGILDDYRQEEIMALSINYYREYLQYAPDDKNIWLTIARLLFYNKNYLGFISWYEESKKKFKFLPSILDFWLLESLYKLKRYDEFLINLRGT